MDIKGFRIIDMPEVGSAVGGNDVHFTFTLHGGENAKFICTHEHLGQIIVGLLRADNIARTERYKNNQEAHQGITYAYDLRELNVAVGGNPPSIILQMNTHLGFSVDFRLPLDIAKQLSGGLAQVIEAVSLGKTTQSNKKNIQ